MPPARAFAITASATEPQRVDASGEASFVFTVSNALGRPVRARATVTPEGDTRREHVGVTGEVERDFAADGTQSWSVRVRVPPETPPGTYAFHLLVASVSNPDDEYADGPRVQFVVAAKEAPRPFPWWIVALVAGVVVLVGGGGLAWWLATRAPGWDQPCGDGDLCADGLACVSEDGARICLTSDGGACGSADDCAGGVCRDGVCASPALGGPCGREDACPADTSCRAGTCKGPPGFSPCTDGAQCETDVCDTTSGRCVYAVGRDCTSTKDCPSGQECGGVGSCLVSQGLDCTRNADCLSGWCDTSGAHPLCGSVTQACASSENCPPGYQCKGGRCGIPDGGACEEHETCSSNWCSSGACRACDIRCGKGQYCWRGACYSYVDVTDLVTDYELYSTTAVMSMSRSLPAGE